MSNIFYCEYGEFILAFIKQIKNLLFIHQISLLSKLEITSVLFFLLIA